MHQRYPRSTNGFCRSSRSSRTCDSSNAANRFIRYKGYVRFASRSIPQIGNYQSTVKLIRSMPPRPMRACIQDAALSAGGSRDALPRRLLPLVLGRILSLLHKFPVRTNKSGAAYMSLSYSLPVGFQPSILCKPLHLRLHSATFMNDFLLVGGSPQCSTDGFPSFFL